jgi:ribonuclease HI
MNTNDFIDEILNDSFKNNNINNESEFEEINTTTLNSNKLSNNKSYNNDSNNKSYNLNNYKLLIFSDGAHERVKKRSTFGIYIISKNKECEFYKYNETKIIKKICKDTFLYNTNNNKIVHHSLFYNNGDDKCKFNGCNYFAIYANNKDNNIGEYCKIHKNDNMIQNIQFYNYDPTNIRAEGLGILYSLIYIKLICVNKINSKDDIITEINNIKLDTNLEFKEYAINLDNKNLNKFLIITDSEFWINVITKWLNNWIKKNQYLDKKNIDIIYYINYYMNLLLDNNIFIEFKFVRGHADKLLNNENNLKNNNENKVKYSIFQKGNIIADKLANIAKDNITNDVKIAL